MQDIPAGLGGAGVGTAAMSPAQTERKNVVTVIIIHIPAGLGGAGVGTAAMSPAQTERKNVVTVIIIHCTSV